MATVLITGGSAGIGLGLAARYLGRGDRVIVTGRRPERLAAALPGLETIAGDISDPADRERLAARVPPGLDVLINNAGIQRRVPIAADDTPWSESQAEIDTLLGGPVHLTRLLLPVLLAAGRPSLIVNVTSGGAFVPQPFAPLYSAAKAALHSWTINLRYALAATPCRVVELIPPAVATGLAGPGQAHGADPDEFCDAVFPLLDGSRPEVGFGPTASPAFMERAAGERAMFDGLAGRFDVPRFLLTA
jgi:uncharacterized oxidoreductase